MKKSSIPGCFAWMGCWRCAGLYAVLWFAIVLSFEKASVESFWIKLLTLGLILVFYRSHLLQQNKL